MNSGKQVTDVGRGGDPGNPLVSIIIPCYNTQRYLAGAIESALDQTHPNIEVIVIDDSSSDESLAVAERYADRIRIEQLRGNRGPSAARNHGVRIAGGEFIQFLDADDLLHPEKVTACLRAYGPDVDWVLAQNAYFRDGEQPSQHQPSLLDRIAELARQPAMKWDPDRVREYILRREVQTASPLHRRSLLIESGGFREELWSLEDIELHFRLASSARVVRKIEDVLVYCRHHGSPTRLRIREGRFTVALEALGHIHQAALARGPLAPDLKSALGDRYANLGRKLLWSGCETEGRRALTVALALTPRPNPTGVPVYNFLSRAIGPLRMERMGLAAFRACGAIVRPLSRKPRRSHQPPVTHELTAPRSNGDGKHP